MQDKTAKSAMALANIRDGGAIVFGVAQQGDDFVPVGMTPNDAASFNNDDVIAYVNKYADPYVELSVSQVTTEEGKRFVVIQVREFAEIPVVCKRDGTERLTKGAIYIRTRRMPETAVVPSQTEMRELVELAVEKGIQRFLATSQRVGILPLPSPAPSDQELFDDQLGEL